MAAQSTLRLVEIAELLGVSKQRAHQLAGEAGFPAPVAEDYRGRLWSRRDVQAWAERWRAEKPWRRGGYDGRALHDIRSALGLNLGLLRT